MRAVGGTGKRVVIRFSTRRITGSRRHVEVAHFYGPSGARVFHARCERGVIVGFLERVGGAVSRSRTGKTIYVDGARAEDLLRRLVILAGSRQCVRKPSKVRDVAEVVAGLGEFEAIFWYSKILDEYEKRGYWGVCRVAKSLRVLYRVD